MTRIYILIPAYNEATVIGRVVSQIKKEGFENVIVIDDCSKDDTAKVAKKAGARVITHKQNKGAGGATYTGIKLARKEGADFAVTLDADGQHDPREITKLIRAAQKGNFDVVIGSRMINPSGMPFNRWLLNFGGSIITWMLYGIHVHDSQSGFKVFNHKALTKMKIHMERFEFCSEILYRIRKNKLSYKEVHIRTIYTQYSLSKGQHALNAFKMLWRMILTRFRLSKIEHEEE